MLACGISLTFSILFFLFALVFSASSTNFLPSVRRMNRNLITTISIITKKKKTTLSASGNITHVYYELLDYRAVAVVASFVPDG